MDKPDFAIRPQSLTKTARFINFFLHRIIRIALWVMRVDFKVTNGDILPRKGPAVLLCAEHTSLADAIFMIASIKRSTYAGVGMAELLTDEWPWIIRKAFELLGHIPIERGNSVSGDLVFEHGKHALGYGQLLVLWPHGKQIRPGEDATWYPGFARFSKTMSAPLYIFKIEGADKFWPTHPDDGGPQDKNWRAKVRATFTGPIDPRDYATVDDLLQAARTAFDELSVPE